MNKMNNKFQRGATMWSTLLIVMMAGLVVYQGFLIGNIYLDYKFIRSSMQNVVDQSDFKSMTSNQVISTINKRLTIDNIRGLDNDVITMKRDVKTDEKYLKLLYTAKANVASNIFIQVEFDEEIRPAK